MCTCPNYMIWTGRYTHNDKPKLEFIGHHQYDHIIEKLKDVPYIQVPCGQCLECRIQHARTWADRCVLEAKQYKDNYFVTLTYDDAHLPAKNSLQPKDLTNFMKRLRKHFEGTKIRFLACGEYGDTSRRPHFHVLLFNCPLDDLSYNFQLMENGRLVNHLRPVNKGDLKFSKTIYELWQYQGMISVAPFNYDTAAYVSQYVTKKCNPNMKQLYDELGIVPEFIRMSNRPGIGAQYFQDHDDIHDIGHVIVPCDGEAHVSAVPRYYDKLFQKKYGEDVFLPIQIKRLRKKIVKFNTYVNGSSNYDRDAEIRDYKLKKRKILRQSI